jgi:hypothetical protein
MFVFQGRDGQKGKLESGYKYISKTTRVLVGTTLAELRETMSFRLLARTILPNCFYSFVIPLDARSEPGSSSFPEYLPVGWLASAHAPVEPMPSVAANI